jgi:predicted transcriptional regulator
MATKEFLNEEDENVIPGVPRTAEELNAAVAMAMEDIEAGRTYTTEELFKKHPEWL